MRRHGEFQVRRAMSTSTRSSVEQQPEEKIEIPNGNGFKKLMEGILQYRKIVRPYLLEQFQAIKDNPQVGKPNPDKMVTGFIVVGMVYSR